MRVGSILSYNGIAYNQLRQRATSLSVIQGMLLDDGFYLVGGFRSDIVGHWFVMEVAECSHAVHEHGEQIDIDIYDEWVCQLSFVRRVKFIYNTNTFLDLLLQTLGGKARHSAPSRAHNNAFGHDSAVFV